MFQPTLSFLCLEDLPSQDADGIVKAFSIHGLHHPLQKMIGIAKNDGTSVNSGFKGGRTAKFREEEEFSCLSFIWFLSL